MNDWLKSEHERLYTELDVLGTPHPSRRDNAPIIAQTTGALDACTLLKDTPVDAARLTEVERQVSDAKPRGISPDMQTYYVKGCKDFICTCRVRLGQN
ncbi:MAG: hypothetical protein V4673_14870 [Pseudomonadota bacterium]